MPQNSTFKKTAVPIFIDNKAIFNLGFLSCYVTTQLNDHVVLYVEQLNPQSPPYQAWRP